MPAGATHDHEPRPEPRGTFERLMADLDYAMFIITTADAAGARAGCLIGFASQVSIDPPRFLVCISVKNHTHQVIGRAEVAVVHFVPEDAHGLAELFGGTTGDEADKFARCAWRVGPQGAPVLDDLENWFAGRILERVELGDHTGFLLEPIDGEARRGQDQLTFHRARRIEPGHAA